MRKISNYYAIDPFSFRYISHHGILGQKWGVRRYQNEDGTLTDTGKKRYAKDSADLVKQKKHFEKREIKYDKANLKFKKRARRLTITDTDLELKRRAGVKLAKRYRSVTRSGERFVRKYAAMQKRYGINNLSKEQIMIGEEITERLSKIK